jgi:hypothetical protein
MVTKESSMRKILLAAIALGGLTALAASGASAAPSAAGVHVVQPPVTDVDYYWHHQHYHHRHWEHHQWRYWN